MSEPLRVYAIGSKVKIDSGLEATVTGVTIRDRGLVSYNVVWWDERSRRDEWLAEFEVESLAGETMEVGFR